MTTPKLQLAPALREIKKDNDVTSIVGLRMGVAQLHDDGTISVAMSQTPMLHPVLRLVPAAVEGRYEVIGRTQFMQPGIIAKDESGEDCTSELFDLFLAGDLDLFQDIEEGE